MSLKDKYKDMIKPVSNLSGWSKFPNYNEIFHVIIGKSNEQKR